MPTFTGIHLLPATGEYAYDTIPFIGAQRNFFSDDSLLPAQFLNTFFAPGGSKTDYSYSVDQLQSLHPECKTVSVVVSWFFNSEDASTCNIYPSTIFLLGDIWEVVSGTPVPTHWMVSSLTEQDFPGLIPIPFLPGTTSFVYGGTPSDPSIVRCIRDLKSRGFKVLFYPFLLGTGTGFPWRGRISSPGDLSQTATNDVATFMGNATTGDFTPDATNLTVAYSGFLLDWTYRRMILHYANLVTIAGGVDLFVIGSELRGLEILRGPAWTKAGTIDGSGNAIWDYPMVAALNTLANDVRKTFDNLGFTKTGGKNLITYSADWSSWMGWQHTGENGQWPHLDQLWSNPNIDFVSYDNYLPLTDMTTNPNGGGMDAVFWQVPAYTAPWPPTPATMNGLGLTGPATIYSLPYIKRGIEHGQYFDWFYFSSDTPGTGTSHGLDPFGSDMQVSLPTDDRLAQSRNQYFANQEILGNKQVRWWWNNLHQAVYDNGDGTGFSPHGPQTEWVPNSKSTIMLEYGFAACDKSPNQPNVFFDPKSTESFTAFWSVWDPSNEGGYMPQRDDTIQAMALDAIYEYWNVDGNNETISGVDMIDFTFCLAWNWDARPFPVFPLNGTAWGDTGNWEQGFSITGGSPARPPSPPPVPTAPPGPGTYPNFPSISTVGWSVHVKPKFSTLIAQHVSGRETRGQLYANPLCEFELTYEVLRSAAAFAELQAIASFFAQVSGQNLPFWFSPPNLAGGPYLSRFAEDVQDFEEFMTMLFELQTLRLQTVR